MTEERSESVESEPATQRDLELWGGQLQHQMQGLEEKMEQRIVQSEEKMAQRIEQSEEKMAQLIHSWGEKIMDHIDVAVENRQVDVGMASVEQVEALAENVDDHERRLQAMEK